MLQIKNIHKQYKTGSFVQKALDGVSLNLRENEFVAILGPSGSGKTTLLNIIGGLDRYDSGDLIINGISTKRYKDRDWDSYRNHTIGFVFQSYNLIPHQTVLSNVELALTISGIPRDERRKRAKHALEQVGLGEQLHKKPNQMSGGQMQRVAIARALVNDPDILLADEPTGALDSDTSVQVMELLKEVARDRLVVMVTHNPELAEAYATRIVNLRDGRIRSDSDPFAPEEDELDPPVHKNMGKASMSFLTALSLSFHNLRTKKARTLLTSFAGSIGIIGIALILSLSNGVNDYIQSVEEETLSEYPLQIQSVGMDMTSMMLSIGESSSEDSEDNVHVIPMITNMLSKADPNDLKSLKQYLETGDSGIEKYTNAVEYSYDVSPQIYRMEKDGVRQVHPDQSFSALGFNTASANSMMSSMMSTDVFFQMPENTELYQDQYEIKAGRWPESYDECVVVLTSGGGISDFMLYTLGLRDSVELDDMIRRFLDEEEAQMPDDMHGYTYEEFPGIAFRLVNGADRYEYDDTYQVWKDKSDDKAYMKRLVNDGEELTVVGVVQPSEESSAAMLKSGIGYPASLTEHTIRQAGKSLIVRQQLAKPGLNVLTGSPFGEDDGQNVFEMESLFTVNEEAMQDAFGFDPDALEMGSGMGLDSGALGLDPGALGLDSGALGLDPDSMGLDPDTMGMDPGAMDMTEWFGTEDGSLDLSGLLDPDQIELDPGLGDLDLGALLGELDFSVSPEALQQLITNVMQGYGDYAASHPEADYSGLAGHFVAYLQSPQASQKIQELLLSGVRVNITSEQLTVLIQDIMSGYQEFIFTNGYTDPDKFSEYLLEYLQTPAAQEKIAVGLTELLQNNVEITVTPEQLQTFAEDLAAGYIEYAAANALPDPSKMGNHFMAYLQTPEARKLLSEGIGEIIDLSALESQVTELMGTYMETLMSSFSGVIADLLQEQIASVLQQIMEQMVTNMQAVMTEAMTQTGLSLQTAMQEAMGQIAGSIQAAMQEAMGQIGSGLENAFHIDAEAFMNAIEMNMDEEELNELFRSLMSGENASYDNNLKKFGYADTDNPSQIDIYPCDFESKACILDLLDAYNDRMEKEGAEDKVITYTDFVGTLMSSVTDIIDIISYVLVAFVAISLVVSSIMIGVITYISVLERRKEIGILRAVGASRQNISQVFNAETFIIGACAGVIGILLTLLLLIPGNALIHALAGQTNVNAFLPPAAGIILIVLSILLTLLGGLIPSKKAAKSDPVSALRSE